MITFNTVPIHHPDEAAFVTVTTRLTVDSRNMAL
jgi:hypothetical protein